MHKNPTKIDFDRESLGKRISYLVDIFDKKSTAAQVAGISVEQLNKWITGRVKVPVEALFALSKAANVDFNWLCSGDEVPSAAKTTAAGVPVYNVLVSAGPGLFPEGEEVIGTMPFDKAFLAGLGLSAANAFVVHVRGDSMHPTIPDGSMLLVDKAINTIVGNGIYVVSVGEAVLVKRVSQRVSGAVELISDNHAYKPEVIERPDLENLRIAGRVKWIGKPA